MSMQPILSDAARKRRSYSPLTPAAYPAVKATGGHEFVPGESVAIRAVRETLVELTGRSIPVLLVGERGTGKKTLALAVHDSGAGGTREFTRIDCARLPSGFLQAGSYPENGDGIFPGINNGTLLLAEITDLRLPSQAKLVTAISGILAARAKGPDSISLIATTTKELQNEVRGGRFREDLYYLLSSVSLRLPPLRYRRADIPALTDYFLGQSAAALQRNKPALSVAMHRFLMEYPWPGNIEELRETITMIVAMADEALAIAALRSRAQEIQRSGGLPKIISLKQAAQAASRNAERELISKVLSRTNWNRKRAAQELQISYKALLYKLKQTGLHNGASS